MWFISYESPLFCFHVEDHCFEEQQFPLKVMIFYKIKIKFHVVKESAFPRGLNLCQSRNQMKTKHVYNIVLKTFRLLIIEVSL